MQLKKTKLAGIISLLLCSNAMAVDISEPPIAILEDSSRFGPFVSAMDTSSAAVATTNVATYTNTYAQPFTYDIGAPWTYNEYCQYNDDVCELFWDGSKSDGSDGLYAWRRNILSTYADRNGSYKSETTSLVSANVQGDTVNLTESRRITDINTDSDFVGFGTDSSSNQRIVRRGFYNSPASTSNIDVELIPSFTRNGGFSSAYGLADIKVISSTQTYTQRLAFGQSSVRWGSADSNSDRFNYCYNYPIDDDRNSFDDLYYCPGFDLQASYWEVDGPDTTPVTSTVQYLSSAWIDNDNDASYVANAYSMNSSGVAVGFSTEQIGSSTSSGRGRAVYFKPEVSSDGLSLNYQMTEITELRNDVSDFDDAIRNTVAIDITDSVVEAFTDSDDVFNTALGKDNETEAFVVVGNRQYAQSQNRSYATEFFTYNLKTGQTRYPFAGNPIKGANSQVSKINNDGLIVGWRDARGETSPTADGSARFQSAFIYDYKNKKSAYLDDLYCGGIPDADVKYRFTNAISISEMKDTGDGNDLTNTYTIVANGFDYVNVENYKNRVGSTPVVLSMTVTKAELDTFDGSSQCPIKAEEDYERSGAGMGWFVLLPTMMLLFRRFKR
jgi:hypothetical protein